MNRMRRRLTALVAAFTAGATGTLLTVTVVAPTPARAAGETLVATIVETSDIHAEGYPAANLENMNATARVATAQNPDGVLLAGDSTLDGLAAEFQAFDESGWGALKSKILAAPGNHDWQQAPPTPFMNYFGYSTTYNSRDVAGVHLITLDADTSSGSPGLNVGGEQYNWLHADLDAHAGVPIFAAWHYPRYSIGNVHGDQDSTEIRNAWNLLQEHGAEMIFAGHDHLYQRFPKANADGTLNPATGLREIVGATGGSGYLYGVDPSASVLTPEYTQNTTEGIVRIKVYTDHLEWAHVGVDGVVRDSGSDTLRHPVGPSDNAPPAVNAGSDQTVILPAAASLDGTVTDDGQPGPAQVATAWTKVSGPGTVAFGDANAVDTSATFGTDGTYVLRLTANDGALSGSDDVAVTVRPQGQPPAGTVTITRQIAASSDDAEEYVANYSVGTVALTSSDLDLVNDGGVPQAIGLRFPNLAVPAGATVTDARVQFQTDEATSGGTALTLRGQAADSAASFAATTNNITSRPTTTAAVGWTPNPWPTVGAAGADQRTPNLAALFQEIVNRPGWTSGNAAAVLVTGTGARVAEAVEGSGGPTLTLTYGTETPPPPTNQGPVVSAGDDQSVTLPSVALLSGTVSDDGLPTGATLTHEWTKVAGPGTVFIGDASSLSTTAGFSEAGTYVLRLSADDTALTGSDDVTVTVHAAPPPPPSGTTVERRVATASDDAEEYVADFKVGTTNISSNDLELVVDSPAVQRVGLRFTAIDISRGATISNAWVEFQAKDAATGTVALTVRGEAADNPATYAAVLNNITKRAVTTASVPWLAGAWAAGSLYRTPDLAAVIQETVNRPGWASGNALALQISGSTGTRNAYSFHGRGAGAPLLHVEWTSPVQTLESFSGSGSSTTQTWTPNRTW